DRDAAQLGRHGLDLGDGAAGDHDARPLAREALGHRAADAAAAAGDEGRPAGEGHARTLNDSYVKYNRAGARVRTPTPRPRASRRAILLLRRRRAPGARIADTPA